MNTINILKRQKNARKLETCYCEGNEDFACEAIKSNMQNLCFREDNDIMSNEIDGSSGGNKNSSFAAKIHKFVLIVSVVIGVLIQAVLSSIGDLFDPRSQD